MNIFDAQLMDEDIEDEVLRYARVQAEMTARRFQSQAWRHILSGEREAGANLMAALLIEVDVIAEVCADFLAECGISDEQMTRLREKSTALYKKRFDK